MASEILKSANYLASRGLPVFRLARGAKVPPAGYPWRSKATIDPFSVDFEFFEHDGNVGVATGRGVIVIDIDAHKRGDATMAALPSLQPTFTVSTPRGGRHLYFETDVHFANSVEAIGPGVDVRGVGGYVVGPGSEWNGKRYEITCDAPIAPLPARLAVLLRESRTPSLGVGATVGELDTPEAIERARAYLEGAPVAAEGARNDATYKHAAKAYDFGISRETCYILVSEHWNARLEAPLDDDELRRTTESAATSRQNPIGSDSPTAGLEEIEEAPSAGPEVDCGRLFEPVTEWVGIEPPPASFVVEGIVPRGFVTILVSAGGRGKSMLAQSMITAVASGSPFLGLRTEQGFAAGMFCEDEADELHRRQQRICRAAGVELADVADKMAPRSWVSRGGDTLLWQEGSRRAGPSALFRAIEQEVAARPDFGLLVIDNASFVFGGSEIDRGQVTRFLAELNRLASRENIAVILIAHESKSSAASDTHAVSGSTAWINAVRSVLKLEQVDGDTDARVLKHIKSNRGARARDIYFSLSTGAPVLREAAPLECKEATLRLVRAAIERRENLSPNKQASNYAARVLAQRDPKFTAGDYEAALVALVSDGALMVGTYGNKGSNSKRYEVATVVGEPSASGGPDGFRRLDEEPSEHWIC